MPPLPDSEPAEIVRAQHRCDTVGKDDEPRYADGVDLRHPEPGKDLGHDAGQEHDLDRSDKAEQPAGGEPAA